MSKINKLNELKEKMIIKFEEQQAMQSERRKRAVVVFPRINDWKSVLENAMEAMVIINLEKMECSERQRFMDFIAGGIYMSGSQLYQITETVFLIVPEDMSISEHVLGNTKKQDTSSILDRLLYGNVT